MGLKGNLAASSLAGVLQALAHGHCTGLLRIQTPEGNRFIELQDGAVSIASRSPDRVQLGDLLVAQDLLKDEDLKSALAKQRETGKLLGAVLVDLRLVSATDLEAALRFQVEEEISDLFLLKAGEYDFLANANLDATMALGQGLMRLKIDANALLLEMARRQEEWRNIEGVIPSQNVFFELTPRGEKAQRSKEALSPEGQVILDLVQNRRSVEAMVHKSCLGRLNVNLLLLELSGAELVRTAPVEHYAEAASGHLRDGRLEEAERLASYAVQVEGDTGRKETLRRILAEVENKRRLAAGSDSSRLARVRSEVIRRPNPALIIRSKRSPLVLIAVLALLVLAGLGAAYWWVYLRGEGRGSAEDLRQFEALAAHIDRLLSEGKYAEALEPLQGRFKDPEVNRAAQDKFRKTKRLLESELESMIRRADAALDARKDAEIAEIKTGLARFERVLIFSDNLRREQMRVHERIGQWREQVRAEELLARLKSVEAQGPAARAEGLRQLLAEDPPELAAAPIRDDLAALAEDERGAARALRRGEGCAEIGFLAGARASWEEAVRLAPGSQVQQRAVERLKGLDERRRQVEERLRQVEIAWIQGARDKAGEDLRKLMAIKLDADAATEARKLWHRYVPNVEDESKAEGLWNEAVRLEEQGQDAAARQQKIEILTRYPYSLTAERVELKVKVDTCPPGARVWVNGKLQEGATPAPFIVPGLGLVRFAFQKPGYLDAERVVYDFCDETLSVALERQPLGRPRRLPFAPTDGLSAAGNLAALLRGAELAVADLSKPGREPLLRKVLRVQVPREGASALRGPLVALEAQGKQGAILVVFSEPRLWCVAWPGGRARSFALSGAPQLPPVSFTDPALPERLFVAAVTTAGMESFDLVEGRSRAAPVKLGAANDVALAQAFDGERLFVATSGGALYALGLITENNWQAKGPQGCVGLASSRRPARLAALGRQGRFVLCDAESGAVRAERDLGCKPAAPPVACGAGFLVLAADGKLQFLSAEAARPLWPQSLAVKASLPPVAVGDAYFALANPEELRVHAAASGQLFWHVPLDSPPAALAASGTRIYLVTQRPELWVFEVE